MKQLLLQKEIFPTGTLYPGVLQRRACDVPEGASVWPQECPSSHEVPEQGLAVASRAGLVCGQALVHHNSQHSAFCFASQCCSSRSSSMEKILCSVAQWSHPNPCQSVFGRGSFWCRHCRHCPCLQVLHAKIFNSAWQTSHHFGNAFGPEILLIFYFLQRWPRGNSKPALSCQINVNLSSLCY